MTLARLGVAGVMAFVWAAGCESRTRMIASFDIGADFSLTQNPNGAWRYGYTNAAAALASQFQLDTYAARTVPIGFWHPDAQNGYYPYLAENSGGSTVADPTGSWALQPGEVAMEGSATGQYSVVQFVVSRPGTYEINASFAGIHFRLSSTDVHVLVGDVSIFDAQIAGYGGDPAFHAVQGASPTATYSAMRALRANDVISFAVGVGPSRDNTNDTTGLFAHVAFVE